LDIPVPSRIVIVEGPSRSICKFLIYKDPGTQNSGVFFTKDIMTEQCEFGCECDVATDFRPFRTVLDAEDLERLITEKTARARRWIELQDKLGGQFETD
jgi:hypothetical protein